MNRSTHGSDSSQARTVGFKNPRLEEMLSTMDILVVEEARYFAKLLRTILRSFNARNTFVAHDAFEAFEMLKTSNIDIAIVDIDLPDIDGIELIQMIRRAEDISNRQMPILLLSGDRRKATVRRAVAAGANDFICKPMSAATLAQKLSRMAMLALCPAIARSTHI